MQGTGSGKQGVKAHFHPLFFLRQFYASPRSAPVRRTEQRFLAAGDESCFMSDKADLAQVRASTALEPHPGLAAISRPDDDAGKTSRDSGHGIRKGKAVRGRL